MTNRMNFMKSAPAVLLAAITGIAHGQATTQIMDFRVPQPTFSPQVEAETFSVPTVGVEAFEGTSIENLVATFSGLSQQAQGNLNGLVGSAEDFRLVSFTSNTQVYNISRFGLVPELTPGNPPRAGAIQWAVDLTPLDGYLSGEGLALDALDLNLDLTYAAIGTGGNRTYDVLLSYTNAAESIELTSISTTIDSDFTGSNTNGLILAASRDAGDGAFISPPAALDVADFNEDGVVNAADYTLWRDTPDGASVPRGTGADANNNGTVNGVDYNIWAANFGSEVENPTANTHLVVDSDIGNDVFASADNLTTIDLLALYNAGIREFNVSVLTSGFSPNGRSININGPEVSSNAIGSGVFISTSTASFAIPEPHTMGLASLALTLLPLRRQRR